MAQGEESGERVWKHSTLLLADRPWPWFELCLMHHHLPPRLDAIKTAFCLKKQCQAGLSGAGATASRGDVQPAAARPAPHPGVWRCQAFGVIFKARRELAGRDCYQPWRIVLEMMDKWGGRRGGAALPTQPQTQDASIPSWRDACRAWGLLFQDALQLAGGWPACEHGSARSASPPGERSCGRKELWPEKFSSSVGSVTLGLAGSSSGRARL